MTRIKFFIFLIFAGFSSCTGSYLINSRQSTFIPIENQKEDESIESMIKPFRDSLSSQMNEIIGKSEMEMKTGQPESLLGNFICDILLTDLQRQLEIKINDKYFSLLNFRGLRAPLHQGEIKVGDIFEIMPFENELVIVELKGSDLLKMFEFLSGYGGQPVSSNVHLIVKKDKSYEVSISNKNIDTIQTYQIITTDYLANGGDNMTFFKNAVSIQQTSLKLRDYIINTVKYFNSIGKSCTATLDERIKYE